MTCNISFHYHNPLLVSLLSMSDERTISVVDVQTVEAGCVDHCLILIIEGEFAVKLNSLVDRQYYRLSGLFVYSTTKDKSFMLHVLIILSQGYRCCEL